MNLERLQQFNWVDVFVVILLLRIIYCAVKNGIFIEFFKLLGMLLSCYLSLHYYTKLSDFFKRRIPAAESFSVGVWDVLALFILSILGYIIFVLLRESFFRFVKTEAVSALNKWGAAILGVMRGFLLTSLIIFMLSIPLADYFRDSVRSSFSGRRLIKLSTGVYSYLWETIVTKFTPQEEANKVVLEVQDEILK